MVTLYLHGCRLLWEWCLQTKNCQNTQLCPQPVCGGACVCVRVPVHVRVCVQQMYRWPLRAHRGDIHSLAQFLSAAQTVANGPSPGCIYRPFVAWVELIWRSKSWTWQAVTGFQHLTFISDYTIFPRWVHWRDCSIWHYSHLVSDLFV